MKKYIDCAELLKEIKEKRDVAEKCGVNVMVDAYEIMSVVLGNAPAADVVKVCRCQNCIHSVPFERNCELNSTAYMHCTLGRGEETLNVWHKYKKYYRDYSVVDRDGFCDEGERRAE